MHMPLTTYSIFQGLGILIIKMHIQQEKFIFKLWKEIEGDSNSL